MSLAFLYATVSLITYSPLSNLKSPPNLTNEKNQSSISPLHLIMSEIANFFKNQTIFLTGGTGFLGKIILEKLLRECPEIKKIFLILRPKKGKTAQERFNELFEIPVSNSKRH